jgi:hypothetical protein
VLSKEPEKRPDSAEAMIAELTRAKETAVVTSGVRASLVSGLESVLERSPRSVPPPPNPQTPATLTHDTLSLPAGVPRKSRRWFALIVGVVLLVGAIVAVLGFAATSRRAATTPVATVPVLPPPPAVPPVVTASATATTAPAPVRSAPAASSVAPIIPTVAATALPHPEPTRPERAPRPTRTGPRPAGTSSVGYGYLE